MANRRRFAGASALASFPSRLALIGLLAIALQLPSPQVSATGDPPHITQPVLAVIDGHPGLGQPVSDPLVIKGSGFGSPGPSSGLKFVCGGETVYVGSGDPAIVAWGTDESGNERIEVQVPDRVCTGTLRVVAGEQESAPVDLLVYEYRSIDIPSPPGYPYGLALAVAGEQTPTPGKIWMDRESYLSLQGFDPQSRSFTTLSVPQEVAQKGIFASRPLDQSDQDQRTRGRGEGRL